MSDVKIANPAVLGLLGYGMSTVLLSLANSGVYPVDGMIFAMAIFFGGAAQTLVASMLFKLGDTFGVTAFGGFSFLWLSFAFINIGAINEWWTVTSVGVGWYLIIWMVFTIGLLIASVVAPSMLTVILGLTVILLGSLGLGSITGNTALGRFGGYEGVLTGALAIYLAFAFLINEMYGKTVLPIGKPIRN
ncbi:MAG: acetate uptake transporter [Candidatus Nanopelagicaceae bacterium]|nr:acetate uptake transporter [Candidatus Nanopelagicaceae bacterium]